jgi:glycosyltransferase involved in cell wall biosynthesis
VVVVILGNDFLIHGSGAASNLIRNLAKGFSENGATVHVINMNMEYGVFKGHHDGINFYIPLEQEKRNKYFVIRIFYRILRFFNVFSYINAFGKSSERKVIITFSESLRLFILSYILNFFFFQLSVIYAVEHPFRHNKNNLITPVKSFLFQFIVYHIFDGILAISTNLLKYYKKFGYGKKLNLIIPPITDPNLFSKKKPNPFDFEYIAYSGTLSRKKDGIDILLNAFSGVNKKFPKVKLVLIGKEANKKELKDIKGIIKSNNLDNTVIFTGQVSFEKVAEYISHAKLLVLARPSNLQNETGFPSKLPEYLSTKIPVLLTNVSDIPIYFTHNLNCLIAEAGDTNDFAEKILFGLENYENTKEIGVKGGELANTTFNYIYQTSKLLETFNNYSVKKCHLKYKSK